MNTDFKICFSRISGTQNTFFIVNTFISPWREIYRSLSEKAKRDLAYQVCSSFHGFKTDGLVFLLEDPILDFKWDFFNSDGSSAEMCGNAARCASFFFNEFINDKNEIHFITGAGPISSRKLTKDIYEIQMNEVKFVKEINSDLTKGILLNTGVPHFVIEEDANLKVAKNLRNTSLFGPSGANITFVNKTSNFDISAVTFERGVEDFTQACGTGAVAAATYFNFKEKIDQSWLVKMPGGDLTVNNAVFNRKPTLSGPVKFEFEINFSFNQLIGSINEKI